jgi:hypothetical protein
VSTPERFSRPALPADATGMPARPATTVEAREDLVMAAAAYDTGRTEKTAWAMEAAAWKLLAAIYGLEGV